MTKRLSKADLTAIRERAEKATEGEWRIADTTEGAWLLDGNDLIIAGTFERIEDAVFSKHARQDIPKLLAEIDRYKEIERKIRSLTGRAFITTDKQIFEIIREINEIYYGGDNE